MRMPCGTILAAALVAGCAGLSPNAATSVEFNVLSYNVHHCRGMDGELSAARIAAILNRERPRFAALQEIDRRTVRSGGMDEAREIERLTGMTPTFAKTIDFQGGEYGLMILSRDNPLSVEKFPLPGAEPRVLLLAEFPDCFVGCTHLSVADEQERVDSVAIIKKAVEGRGKPVFLAGDWNSLPDSPVLNELRGFLRVVSRTDCRTFHGKSSAGPSGAAKDFCIDYIAVDSAHAGSFMVVDRDVILDRISSDHAPVKVTLTPVRQLSSATFTNAKVAD